MDSDPSSLNRATYDRIAAKFAEVNKDIPPNLVEAAERLLTRLGGQPGRILDLGCGTGRDLAWFAARGARCAGADLSLGMLRQARQRSSAPLCQMDLRSLGFASGSFAGIWCVAALLHVPKAQAPAALAEMKRILTPGGALFLDIQAGSGEVIEREPYTSSADRFFSRYSLDEMAGMLENNGFQLLARGEMATKRHWLWFEAARPV